MSIVVLPQDDEYVLNYCARYLTRENQEIRHNYGQFEEQDALGSICESWRFPSVDSYWDGKDPKTSYFYNRVTFVYKHSGSSPPGEVRLIGNFACLYESFLLQPVRFLGEPTVYHALTLVLPKGKVYVYKFIVDGRVCLDAINPQRVVLDNGQPWSRLFTDLCPELLSFEPAEVELLARLTGSVLPLHRAERRCFIDRYYEQIDRESRKVEYAHTQRLDRSVGVVNFIDKLLARQERHHLIAYRLCLPIIDKLLRAAHPDSEPAQLPEVVFDELCRAMARGRVPGWDYTAYNSPAYFLQLLRRHTFTGAFSHPKYGGNVGAAGWAYLEERYRNPEGDTLFAWRRAIEYPLGSSTVYRG
ncbi:MAG: gluconate 2-dehydrogenase subunit 3 family protein [Aphanocapsa lilacina HA4352-LM1]|jgi:hypothetical protein|nr:gluconate 2-dehydrogenase subunit 3 family protein [Aphanocapsa lilacina HA4352-LM1]